MARRADILFAQTTGLLQFSGGGTHYIVRTPAGVLYMVYVDTASDPSFRKSTDGGLTWGNPIVLKAMTTTQFAVWYDRWSGIDAGKIHVVYTDSGVDDVFYRSIDTENSDALSAETVVFAGASTAAGGAISVARARGGNIGVAYMIDAGAELGFAVSTDAGATWNARSSPIEATTDQIILLPGFAADNQDMMAIYWDASADEISRKVYDDSGDSWAETSIAGSMVDTASTSSAPHFSATVDLTNSQIILVAWSRVDYANADLRCWTVTESAITEVTNVVLNSTDDQGLCAVAIDSNSGWWYVFYAGKSDGSETFGTAVNLYYKVSKDSGSTWGSEEGISTMAYNIKWLSVCPILTKLPFIVAFHNDISLDELMISVVITQPRVQSLLGV